MELPEFTLRPIGLIRTPFQDRYAAPRQGSVAPGGTEGQILLAPGHNFEQALHDLEGFEKIWLIYWFNRNQTWKPKILPPRGGRQKRGVFATRAPHRPNPIGLTVATLLGVKGRCISVADIDLLDQTPILDIKPYLPYADAFPHARIGWLDAVEKQAEAGPAFEITWGTRAAVQARFLTTEFGLHLAQWAERILQRDATPHPYRRIRLRADQQMELALKSWRVLFSVKDKLVRINAIRSGFTAQALTAATRAKPLHHHDAHLAFHARWPEECKAHGTP